MCTFTFLRCPNLAVLPFEKKPGYVFKPKNGSNIPILYSAEYTRRREHQKFRLALVFRSKSNDVGWLRGFPNMQFCF